MLTKPFLAPLAGVAVALMVGLAGEYGFMLEKQRIEQDQRARVISAVGEYRAALEGELNETLFLANGFTAYVETQERLNPILIRAMMRSLYQHGRNIRNIGLAPGNRLTYIYPEKGNEKAIGLYYPDSPDQWPATQQAISEHRPILAGPVKLKQGGMGFIYRVPVYVGAQARYWGLISMVLDEERLFERVGIAPQVNQLQFALRRKDGAGANGETFLGEAALFDADSIKANVSTPGGEWQIAAMPVYGWTKGGRVVWLPITSWAVGFLLGISVYFSLNAVARRLRAEIATKKSRDDLNEAQRIAMMGSWVLNLRSNQLEWSDEIFRIFEISPDKFEASYEGFLNAIHPDDRDMVNQAYTESLANHTPYNIVHRLVFDDGRTKYVRERCETQYADNGIPLISRGTVQDITKLYETQQALRVSEERWKFALEGAGDGVWDWNIQTGEMFLSRQEMTVLGYEGEGPIQTNISEWIDRQHPDDRSVRKAALERYFSGEEPFYACEFRTKGRDGSLRWILARGMLVNRMADGKPLRMIGTHTNITERKQAEQALRENEEKLRGLFELSPLGIALTDMKGHYLEFNKAFRQICGYTDEELKKLDYWMLTPKKYAVEEQRQLESLSQTGSYGPYEKEYVRKDGKLVPLRLNGMLVTGRDGHQYIWSIVEDISLVKQSEAALKEQRDFLSTVLENEPECVKVVGGDGTLLQINAAGLNMLEVSSIGEANMYGLSNFVLPEYRARFSELEERALLGHSGVLEFQIQGKEGTRRWLELHAAPLRNAAGNVTHVVGVARDITRRREAEQRLALSLQGADLAMTDWDVGSDRIVLGEGWSRLLGIEPHDLPTKSVLLMALLEPDDALAARDALVRHLKGESPFFEAELRVKHKHGRWVWILARGMAVERSAEGRALRVAGTAMDITSRKQAEAEIARLSQWNELLLNSAGEGIYGVTLDGNCKFINPAAIAMLGFTKEALLANKPHDLFHHHHGDGSLYSLEECPTFATLRDGVRREAEDIFIRKNGELFPVQMTITPMHEEGKIVGAEVVFQDIAKRKAMEQELVRLANTDSLTGMANRRRFFEQLEGELARTKRFDTPATLLMLDIDHFKKINDTYGHATGDSVLQHFAKVTELRLRQTDLVGRLGGEEFGILLPGTDVVGGRLFADRFRGYIKESPAQTDKGEISFTVSIGIAQFDPADPRLESIMARADVALYRAKGAGRNRVEAS